MQKSAGLDEFEDESTIDSRREPIGSRKETFSRTPRPKRRATTNSFNGLHRRRKKRIKW